MAGESTRLEQDGSNYRVVIEGNKFATPWFPSPDQAVSAALSASASLDLDEAARANISALSIQT